MPPPKKNNLHFHLCLTMTTMKCKKQVHQPRNTRRRKTAREKPNHQYQHHHRTILRHFRSPCKVPSPNIPPSLAEQNDPGKEEESSEELLKNHEKALILKEPVSTPTKTQKWHFWTQFTHDQKVCSNTGSLFQGILRTDPELFVKQPARQFSECAWALLLEHFDKVHGFFLFSLMGC